MRNDVAYSSKALPQAIVIPGISVVRTVENCIVIVGMEEKLPSVPDNTDVVYPASTGVSSKKSNVPSNPHMLCSNVAYFSGSLSNVFVIFSASENGSSAVAVVVATKANPGSVTPNDIFIKVSGSSNSLCADFQASDTVFTKNHLR
jgi:hypothetical protein